MLMLVPVVAFSISCRSEEAMAFLDSRSAPHMYTMMVMVSRPPPSSLVRLALAPEATEVFSRPVLLPPIQPVDTLPPPV